VRPCARTKKELEVRRRTDAVRSADARRDAADAVALSAAEAVRAEREADSARAASMQAAVGDMRTARWLARALIERAEGKVLTASFPANRMRLPHRLVTSLLPLVAIPTDLPQFARALARVKALVLGGGAESRPRRAPAGRAGAREWPPEVDALICALTEYGALK
jgi:hypothetical protein